MSKLQGDRPLDAEVHHERGELRRPLDRHSEPGQAGSLSPPNDGHERDIRRDPQAEPRTETAPEGTSRRLGGHD